MEGLKLTPEQFFDGLLAAICLKSNVIEGEPTQVHRAFYRVLKELQKAGCAGALDVDLFEVDYDPLYGQSGWFDRAVVNARRDGRLGFANKNITIKYTPAEGEAILNSIGAKNEFERLADVFTSALALMVRYLS